jgi:hypothetical protein
MMTPGETLQARPPGSNDNSRSSQPAIINNYNAFDFRGTSTDTARRNRRQLAQGFGQTVHAMS